MECCQNKNILKHKEMFVCANCATIHKYTILEYDFKFNEYNENIYNLFKCKNTIYKRKKYLNRKYNLIIELYYFNQYQVLFRAS